MNYIIDFERINFLTSHPADNKSTSPYSGNTPVYSISKGILRHYLDIYLGKAYSEEKDNVIETLKYNKILITKSDIREDKLKGIIDDN